jgi:serine/threonine protein phosphatase PrpC
MGNLLGAPVTDKETHTGSDGDKLQWGLSSMQGWRVHMEDAHIAETNLYALDGDGRTKIPLRGHSLFAVFDGHGGTFSAMYSGKNFLRVLSEQPKFVQYARMCNSNESKQSERMTVLEQALQQAFVETDYEIALAIRGNPHPHANQEYHLEGEHQNQQITADADMTDAGHEESMRDAASRAAAEHVSALDDDGDSGTTACIVLITPEAIVCANAGDSRAVFSRRNPSVDVNAPASMVTARQSIALSYDHKPDDESEERRIRAAGGYVAGGRVEGDLAVSRGLGDFRFKSMPVVLNNTQLFKNNDNNNNSTVDRMNDETTSPEDDDDDDDNHGNNTTPFPPGDQKVSPIPDILVHSRNDELDEFVIVACDGIWDVRSNQECVTEVATMFQEGETNVGLISEEVRFHDVYCVCVCVCVCLFY